MDLATFISTLRRDREQRAGPGVYASDKVFALLDELDRPQLLLSHRDRKEK